MQFILDNKDNDISEIELELRANVAAQTEVEVEVEEEKLDCNKRKHIEGDELVVLTARLAKYKALRRKIWGLVHPDINKEKNKELIFGSIREAIENLWTLANTNNKKSLDVLENLYATIFENGEKSDEEIIAVLTVWINKYSQSSQETDQRNKDILDLTLFYEVLMSFIDSDKNISTILAELQQENTELEREINELKNKILERNKARLEIETGKPTGTLSKQYVGRDPAVLALFENQIIQEIVPTSQEIYQYIASKLQEKNFIYEATPYMESEFPDSIFSKFQSGNSIINSNSPATMSQNYNPPVMTMHSQRLDYHLILEGVIINIDLTLTMQPEVRCTLKKIRNNDTEKPTSQPIWNSVTNKIEPQRNLAIIQSELVIYFDSI